MHERKMNTKMIEKINKKEWKNEHKNGWKIE